MPELEQDRNLLRTGQQRIQQGDLHRRLRSLLRRNSLHYQSQTRQKTHCRNQHYSRLEKTIDNFIRQSESQFVTTDASFEEVDDVPAVYAEAVEAPAA
jgi:hypothetical protein